MTRLLDCERSVKSRFNRSRHGNITNDFMVSVLDGQAARQREVLDSFVRVERHYVSRLKERVFRSWAKVVTEVFK